MAISPVYPRWRGEHTIRLWVRYRRDGLSPLARGTLSWVKKHNIMDRFIPAGAGNTSSSSRVYALRPVYPRWRGEHFRSALTEPCKCGLSPLARGTQRFPARPPALKRFIPAGAGNTVEFEQDKCLITVYPRWRGEHWMILVGSNFSPGLSPLARGTQLFFRRHGCGCRFIPAGAGNTDTKTKCADTFPVYPRWRGEHIPPIPGPELIGGLSPLARGTLQS